MRVLTQKEVEEAIDTVFEKNHRSNTYYVDVLKNGEFGVSVDEKPLWVFDSKDSAIQYVNRKTNLY